MGEDPTSLSNAISANALIHDPLAITHLVVLAITLFVCYPTCYFLDVRGGNSSHSHNRYVFYATAGVIVAALLSALVGCTLQPERGQGEPMYNVLRYLLPILIVAHGSVLFLHYKHRDTHYDEPKSSGMASWHGLLLSFGAKSQLVGWLFLVVVCVVYMASALLVFTESVSEPILLPLLFGTGFVMYGTFIALHIFEVISLSPARTPEYYESFVFTACGIACLMIPEKFIIGSAWQALNIGLLWTSSGLLSTTINIQTWMPLLQKRNVLNSLVLTLVGRAITTAPTNDGSFSGKIVEILGFVIILASILNGIHIVLRKSLADQLLSQHSGELDQLDHTFAPHNHSTHCKHADYCSHLGYFSGIIAASLMVAAGLLWASATGRWLERISLWINSPVTYVALTLAFSTVWTVYLFMMASIYICLRSSGGAYYERVGTSDIHHAAVDQDIDLHPVSTKNEPKPPTMKPSEYRAKRLSLRIHSPSDTIGQYHSAQPSIFSPLLDEPAEDVGSPARNTDSPDNLHPLPSQSYDNNIDDAHLDNNTSEPVSPRPANLQ